MDRSEALLRYEETILKYLEEGKQNLIKNSKDVEHEMQVQLKSCIGNLCSQIRTPVCYFQISLVRCMIPHGIYRILVSAHDESYFLDRNVSQCFFDAATLWECLKETQNQLYGACREFKTHIQRFDAEPYIIRLAMEFFKSLGNHMRTFFRDFDQWDCIFLLPETSKLVVKWGEHREYSETIFLKDFRQKDQTQFLERNDKNNVKEWNQHFVYQCFDRAELKERSISMKNFMFLSMRDCQITAVTWENCLIYGSAFRQSFLEQVVFFHCDLSQADFRKTRLKNVRFIECQLTGADFMEAEFEEVEYTGSCMETASFSRNALSCAGLDSVQLQQLKVEEEPLCFS